MDFEEAGRAVDRELQNLKEWFNKKAEPNTRREVAAAMRKAAEHLKDLADRLHTPEP